MTAAAGHLEKRRHFSRWSGAVLLLIGGLIFFAWAGSAANPAAGLPWAWTKTGWIIPAAGLGMLWIAAALLFSLLSETAFLLFNPVERAVTLKPWVSVILILGGGIVLRAFIAPAWTPLHLQTAAVTGGWLAVTGDAVVIAVLLLGLGGAGRSLWWAALYAFHPLVLLEIAGNAGGGHGISWWIAGGLFAVATAHRWPTFFRTAAMGLAAAAAVAAIAWLPGHGEHFNSLAADVCSAFTLNAAIVLPALAAILEALVLWIALARRWTFARALVHIGVIALLCAPVVNPWFVVPVVALIPLAWNSAAWVLSITVMGTYVAMLTKHPASHLHVPEWVLVLEWTPIAVLEFCDLALDVKAAFFPPRPACPSVPPTSALS